MPDVPPEILRAQRAIANLRTFVRRAGLTGWVKDRSAGSQYARALEAVIRAEDALSIQDDRVWRLSRRLSALAREARAAGLLSASDELSATKAALARVDGEALDNGRDEA